MQDLPKSHHTIDDRAIWLRITQGEPLALVQLYDRYADVLYHYGRKITYKSEIIEDAIQDLLAELWYRREKLSIPDSVKAYLLMSFRRTLLKQLLQYQRMLLVGEYFPIEGHDEDHYLRTQILSEIESETNSTLQQAIATLSRKEREAITLKYTENLSHDEIARIMDIKKQTLYNLLHNAIRKLAQSVKAKQPSDRLFTPFAITLLFLSNTLGLFA